jgi:mannitol/fructose-specific phosphotransferase system IIA component (Ntr-type)
MKLADFLNVNNIKVNIQTKSTEGAIHEITKTLSTHPMVKKYDEFYHEVLEREKVETTCLGNGIAIPHARSEFVKGLVVAAGQVPEGVPFNAANPKVKLIFVMGHPTLQSQQYLKFMSIMVKILDNPSIQNRLINAQSSEEFLQILIDEETRLQLPMVS